MNKTPKATYIVIVIIMLSSFFSCKPDNEADPINQVIEVHIPDNNLAQVVRQKLNLNQSEPFTSDNLKGIDSLNLRETGISNLSGLEDMTNLVFLDLRGLPLSDLSPISNLHQIKWLSFRETEISDINALQGFTELEYLNLNRMDNITDLTPISGSTKLKELILRDAQIGNEGMAVISNFTNLRRLNIRNCGISDLSALGQLFSTGALQDKGAEIAVIDIRANQVPNTPTIDGFAPIRPYWDNISDKRPEVLPEPAF